MPIPSHTPQFHTPHTLIVTEPGHESLDITGPSLVEISQSDDGKVIWINVDGQLRLRCCQVKSVQVNHSVRSTPDESEVDEYETVQFQSVVSPYSNGIQWPSDLPMPPPDRCSDITVTVQWKR